MSGDCPAPSLLSPLRLPFSPFSLCIYDNKKSHPEMQRWVVSLLTSPAEGCGSGGHTDDILSLFALFYSNKILGPDHVQGGDCPRV